MERVYAFTDEYGSHGWDLENPSVSTHFIITAVIVEESKMADIKIKAEEIRKKHFQTGEMKSSKVGNKHTRRCKILQDILNLDIMFFPVVINKSEVQHFKGLHWKKSFYKFMNERIHYDLRRAFSSLTVVADSMGSNEFMDSFVKYFESHSEPINLFGESDLMFEDSKDDVLIQIADFISGTLAYVYDLHKQDKTAPDYLKLLSSKISYVRLYPKTFEEFIHDPLGMPHEYDETIAKLCHKQAALFLDKHKEDDDVEIKSQCMVLEYLLFRMMNNNYRGYIPTKELKNQLEYIGMKHMSNSTFRLKIICKLRDAGVIISSSPKGYKIPSNESEIYDFINHGNQVVLPMLWRLKKCRDLVKLATNGEVDLLEHDEYKDLKNFFDFQDGLK